MNLNFILINQKRVFNKKNTFYGTTFTFIYNMLFDQKFNKLILS